MKYVVTRYFTDPDSDEVLHTHQSFRSMRAVYRYVRKMTKERGTLYLDSTRTGTIRL